MPGGEVTTNVALFVAALVVVAVLGAAAKGLRWSEPGDLVVLQLDDARVGAGDAGQPGARGGGPQGVDGAGGTVVEEWPVETPPAVVRCERSVSQSCNAGRLPVGSQVRNTYRCWPQSHFHHGVE